MKTIDKLLLSVRVLHGNESNQNSSYVEYLSWQAREKEKRSERIKAALAKQEESK